MSQEAENQPNNAITSINERINRMDSEIDGMPQVDSETQVLTFLVEHQIPLKPIEVYGGLVHTRTINFKYRTVQNKLRDLSDAGFVERVEIDSDSGEITPLPDDDSDRRAAYLVTDAGVEELEARL